MYIKTGSEITCGKANLLVSAREQRIKVKADPMAKGNVVHFMFSLLVKTNMKQQVQLLDSVVISLDLCNARIIGCFQVARYEAPNDREVKRQAHDVAELNGAFGKASEVEANRSGKYKTSFMSGLSCEGWIAAERLLCEVRSNRIRDRHMQVKSRSEAKKRLKNDLVDLAIDRIITRVNVVMSQLLSLGNVETAMNFPSDLPRH